MSETLTPERLRALFSRRPAIEEIEAPGSSAAAVVLAVGFEPSASVAAVVRGTHLRDHAGEVGFPGGKPEAADADLASTALREMEEEVGVAASEVEVIGGLTPVLVISGRYLIHPFVAIARPGTRFRAASSEVARVIDVPLVAWITGARLASAVSVTYRGRDVLAPHYDLSEPEGPPAVLYGASAYIFHELLCAVAEELGLEMAAPRIETDLPWGDRYPKANLRGPSHR